jgi:hydrogenase maturation factor
MPEMLPAGKLSNELLAALLARYVKSSPRVVVPPGVGRDAAVIDFGDRYLVAKTDPITFATDEAAWYLVNVNANDIATTGATPLWLLCTALLPAGKADAASVEQLFASLNSACSELEIALCGGHTEITTAVVQPVLVGLMLGEVAKDKLIRSDGARPGDAIILTKGIAIEGTALLARELGWLLGSRVQPGTLERARLFLHEPGISVVREAGLALQAGEVHAMHDPTEGGLATALAEMATASGLGVRIQEQAVRILPETSAICSALGLDPWGTLASGALLIACAPSQAPAIVAALNAAGIWAAIIGEFTAQRELLVLGTDGRERPLPTFARDEVARLLESLATG